MRVVVDSSLIVAVCLAGGDLGRLRGPDLHAPAHLPAEAASAIRELHYRGEVGQTVAEDAIGRIGGLDIRYEPAGALVNAAFALSVKLGWATTYDAEYVVLAQTLDAPLVTLDGRLRRGAAHVARVLGPTEL